MRVGVFYTGGKDSHYALLKVVEDGHDVACLITVAAKREDSYMFHTVNIRWSFLHGEAMRLLQYVVEVSGEKEREVEELTRHIEPLTRQCSLEGLVSGVVASKYQKSRIDNIAAKLGLTHIAPLWGYDQEQLLREEVKTLRFIITATAAMGLGPQHLGRIVTPSLAEELIILSRKYGFSPIGEGGEYETYVIESPLMAVEILEGETHWHPAGWGYYEIKKAIVRRIGAKI